MLKLSAIKVTTYTSAEPFSFEMTFKSNLNIVRGDNANGKSTLVQSIFYALGQEELLGGKNSQVLQSCLRKLVKDDNGNNVSALGSTILLQINNGEGSDITLQRSVGVEGVSDKLIEVINGPVITKSNKKYNKESLFVHDAGGASNQYNGFHKWLENYLKWNLPHIPSSRDKESLLYTQLITPAFLIEQKVGWSNYLATMPYYGIREARKRAIEFILNLDASELEHKKKKNESIIERCKSSWKSKYDKLVNTLSSEPINIFGLQQYPHTNFDINDCYLAIETNSSYVDLKTYIGNMKSKFKESELTEVPSINSDNPRLQQKLEEDSNQIQTLSENEEKLRELISIEHSQRIEVQQSMEDIQKEIDRNEGALKVQTFGAEQQSAVAEGACPTCHQPVRDALLPLDIDAIPMSIKDNLVYLKGQKKIYESFLLSSSKDIEKLRNKLKLNKLKQDTLREDIRNARLQLIADPRLPSIVYLRNRMQIEQEIKKFESYEKSLNQTIDEIIPIHNKYKIALEERTKYAKDGLSKKDKDKLQRFTTIFKDLLTKYKFISCDINFIKISTETYLPIIDANELLNETLRNDSSGSDFARVMWAYTLGLAQVSYEFSSNHPLFILFDEPAQHSISNESVRQLFLSLAHGPCQTIVTDSFNNSDSTFDEQTHDVDFQLNRFEGRLLKRR